MKIFILPHVIAAADGGGGGVIKILGKTPKYINK